MNVLDFTTQIPDVLPHEACDQLITLFEESDHKQRLDRGGYPNWTNLFLSTYHPGVNRQLYGLINSLALKYQQLTKTYGEHFNTNDYDIEGCNIKKYVGGTDDAYGRHADSSCLNTSRRFIVILFYLNDNFEGGETVFYPDHIIKPEKGSVLIFPPFWMFPHEARPVIRGEKYIMSTYCLWK